MADYTQSTFFAPKDNLASGNPSKIILGADFDGEFDAISTAIATKYDSDDLASQSEAETGTDNTVLMTPLRTAQRITNILADQSTAETGTDNATLMTPLRSRQSQQSYGPPNARTITAGEALTGGGDLSADRTLNVDFSDASVTQISVEDWSPTYNFIMSNGSSVQRVPVRDLGLSPLILTDTTRTFGLDDASRLLVYNSTSNATWTIPPASTTNFRSGCVILIVNLQATGTLTIDPGTGVSITSVFAQGSTANREVSIGGTAALINLAGDDWLLSGDIA